MNFFNSAFKGFVSIKAFLCLVFCFISLSLLNGMLILGRSKEKQPGPSLTSLAIFSSVSHEILFETTVFIVRQVCKQLNTDGHTRILESVNETAARETVTELTPGIQRYIHEITERQETLKTTQSTKNVRVLCLILTSTVTIESRASVVNATWAKRCDRHFYVLNTKRRSPDIINSPFEETRNNIVHKVKFALNFIYENKIDEFDWLLKADDDTYVIVENLKFLLKKRNSKKPAYLGFHFNRFVSSGYMSGGAGYVISNRALRRLVEFGFNQEKCPVIPNQEDPENSEDIEIGRCLNISGVPVLSSLDEAGRERFHPYPVEKHLLGSIPEFMFEWSKNPHKEGLDCCSKYSISFHYMEPRTMLLVDHLLYRTSVFGLNLQGDNTRL